MQEQPIEGEGRSSQSKGIDAARVVHSSEPSSELARVSISRQESLETPVTAPASSLLSDSEFAARREAEGFAELERHLRSFEKLGVEREDLEHHKLQQGERRHQSPFGKRAGAVAGGALLFGAALGSQLTGFLPLEGAVPAVKLGMGAWMGANLAFIGVLGLTQIQRKLLVPLESMLAKRLAWMLSRRDFRETLGQFERTWETEHRLRELGVNEQWDNPAYRKSYSASGEPIGERNLSKSELLLESVRDFLGHLDTETRKFVPGRFTPHLKRGKKSVTAFLKEHRALVEAVKSQTATVEQGVELLEVLKAQHLKPDARQVASQIDRKIAFLLSEDGVGQGEVQAEIWRRDPWIDLTHQEEFFSSASLRGIKAVGRSAMGRLGTFNYMLNKSISMLDFRTSSGRKIRARLAAAIERDEGGERPVLYVDGVEGSTAVRPKVVHRAIVDYARACGFKAVVYNSLAHNKVPQRFVSYMSEHSGDLRSQRLELVDSSEREYLDAFLVPFEPLEYARPKGLVVGYRDELSFSEVSSAPSPSASDRAQLFLRRHALWMFFGQAAALSTISIASSAPVLAIPAAALLVGGAIFHERFQRRSLKKSSG